MRTYEEPEELNHSDTEITLGLRSILGIFFGLALICGVFFGFGYSLGRGNTSKAIASEQSSATPLGTLSPSAVKTVVEEPASTDIDKSGDESGVDSPVRKSATLLQSKPSAGAPAAQHATDATPAGETPIANESNTPSPLKDTPQSNPVPASTSPSAAIMVQIAAVSHREDADVLISALSKLGYNASVRTGTTDNLLHVQVGPFATRDEAMAMRTKLLNDGYNAILK
jgi:DedD protein